MLTGCMEELVAAPALTGSVTAAAALFCEDEDNELTPMLEDAALA